MSTSGTGTMTTSPFNLIGQELGHNKILYSELFYCVNTNSSCEDRKIRISNLLIIGMSKPVKLYQKVHKIFELRLDR